MGEAKRRQKYREENPSTMPQTTTATPKTDLTDIKQQIKQLQAHTKRAKEEPQFKQECQQQHEQKCQQIAQRISQRNFRDIGQTIEAIRTQPAQVSNEQIERWLDYLIVGLLNTRKIDAVQAQLFAQELAASIWGQPGSYRSEWSSLAKEIAAEKAYLKALEMWVDIDNSLLSIYQGFNQKPSRQ